MIQLLTGFLAAAVHVVTGPDHLAAVTPLAIENRKKAWNIGLMWGIGHVAGMLLIGLLYLAFKSMINVEKISGYSEFLVGFVLIGIGIWAIVKTLGRFHFHHSHPHYHEKPSPQVHIHRHDHHDETNHTHIHSKSTVQNSITALLIGTLHGFAGISHFLLILPTLALPSVRESVTYLAGFAAGTIVAMIIYAVIMGYIGQKTSNFAQSAVFRNLRIIAGALAIAVGTWWLF
ncbi:MAG: sulfite exporter TauE/SafE family protein [Bacteroidales bacterium]|jgi:ABC-type nickel/cobalt efflux system permease component RcnA|nr:sulfite exporter TauE/SafE family protein [Bacteroidales bacterium]